MTTLSPAEVEAVRARIARAHQVAAEEFRRTFVQGRTPPTAHLEMLTEALLREADGVRLSGPAYEIRGNQLTPIYGNFDIDRSPSAVFEYWLIISEITGSASWRMTRVIATPEEYDQALKRMESPQLVRALVTSFLPSVDVRDDGVALLEVTVYTRADEERIERRSLLLDAENEFHFHGRQLIAEGEGGVAAG